MKNELKKAYKKLETLNNKSISIIQYEIECIKSKDKKFAKICEEHLVYSNLFMAESKRFEDNLVNYLVQKKLMTKEEIIKIAEMSGKEDFQICDTTKKQEND